MPKTPWIKRQKSKIIYEGPLKEEFIIQTLFIEDGYYGISQGINLTATEYRLTE